MTRSSVKSRPSKASPRRLEPKSTHNGRRETGRIAVLDRASALLVALSQLGRTSSLNEIATHSGLSKATAFRILATLTELGLVEQDTTTASYRLGIASLRIASAVLDGIPVHAIARPVMRSVTEMLNETVVLSVRDGDHRVNIDAVECTNAISSSRRIGEPRPLHSGAPSRILLASMPDDEIEAYIKRHRLEGKGRAGAAYVANLWKDIRGARRAGFITMPAETSPESHAVATIIRDPHGAPIAALHVAIPRGRISPRVESRCGMALLRASAEITRGLAQSGKDSG